MDEQYIFNCLKDDNIDEFVKIFPNQINSNFRFSTEISQFSSLFLDSPSLISVAAFYGSLQILNHFIEQKIDLNMKDNLNRGIENFAVAGAHLFAIKILFDNGIDFKYTLHFASGMGDLEVLKFLIEKLNIDPTIIDSYGSTILHSSIMSGDIDIIKYCFSLKRLSINSTDNNGVFYFRLIIHLYISQFYMVIYQF